jgi:hypothetical protein
LNLYYGAKPCSDANDTTKLAVGKDSLCFLKKHIARVVITKACIDKFDLVSAALDRLEKSGCSGSSSSHLPDRAILEILGSLICLEEGWRSIDVVLCDGEYNTI